MALGSQPFIRLTGSRQLPKWPSEFMRAWNDHPKPFIWTASVGQIIEKIERARSKAEQIKPGSTLP
jgi:hypothetical protein